MTSKVAGRVGAHFDGLTGGGAEGRARASQGEAQKARSPAEQPQQAGARPLTLNNHTTLLAVDPNRQPLRSALRVGLKVCKNQ